MYRCQRYQKLKTQAPDLTYIKVNKVMELVGFVLTSVRSIFSRATSNHRDWVVGS